jgi:hypothetical protein
MRGPAPAWIGLVALFPLMLSPSLVAARDTVGIALCSADGSSRTVQVPVGPAKLPGEGKDDCCAKGCHAAGSRKRSNSAHS